VSDDDVYVSLGSNLGDRAAQLARALAAMDRLPATRVVALSPVFETDPVGPPPQGPHLNAAARLASGLEPRALLAQLLAIETAAGRTRGGGRWTARTLDLDILLHGARVVNEPGLVVPHPRLAERAFVLEPLAALAPALRHPLLGASMAELAARVRDPRAVRPWTGAPIEWRPRAAQPPGITRP
jgi:2-amino-4-hydroxy-6-hydroxymethyldihydropteridine diphosphokinase